MGVVDVLGELVENAEGVLFVVDQNSVGEFFAGDPPVG